MEVYFYGVDPATSKTGIAILDKDKALFHYEIITGEANSPASYEELYNRLLVLYSIFPPTAVWIEDSFFGANIDTLKKITRVSSIVMLTLSEGNIPFELKTPGSWRKALMGKGKGNTSKRDTYDYVNSLYGNRFTSFNKHNDLTDAIGLAWGCADSFKGE